MAGAFSWSVAEISDRQTPEVWAQDAEAIVDSRRNVIWQHPSLHEHAPETRAAKETEPDIFQTPWRTARRAAA